MALMAAVKQQAPSEMVNAEVLLRDQFVEYVVDGSLRRALKQFVRGRPSATLLDVRAEAIRWEREGISGGPRGRAHSMPSVLGLQYGVQCPPAAGGPGFFPAAELSEIKEMLKLQQDQINKLAQNVSSLQGTRKKPRPTNHDPIICRRCQQARHYASDYDGVRVSRPQPTQPPRPTARQSEN
uniref:Uncharacterized protein n=1 Tax=Nothobranchius furzeri TaxID=105023 RepID=A0A1A8U882_NOTFU